MEIFSDVRVLTLQSFGKIVVNFLPWRQMHLFSRLSENRMPTRCNHLDGITTDQPRTRGCEECLKTGDSWVHLRLCRMCGHVGCCDDSKNRHATKLFQTTRHAIMSSLEPGEKWSWCYVDEVVLVVR